jgi:hypothetical protein
MAKRFAYGLAGFCIGLALYFGLAAVLRRHARGAGAAGAGVAFSSLAILVAERMGRVQSIEDINRPATLFPGGFKETSGPKNSK